jgi:glycine oxidase
LNKGAFRVVAQRAGIRVNLPDKRPVAGRHPEHPRLGLINGLGAKGALWAPLLAQQWMANVTTGAPFSAEIDVGRFAK